MVEILGLVWSCYGGSSRLRSLRFQTCMVPRNSHNRGLGASVHMHHLANVLGSRRVCASIGSCGKSTC